MRGGFSLWLDRVSEARVRSLVRRTSVLSNTRQGCSRHETNLPAEPNSSKTGSWLPRADADSGWPGDHQTPPSKRAEALSCLRTLEIEMNRGAARLRRTDRLRKSKDFRRISRQGLRMSSAHFVVIIGQHQCDDGGTGPTLGITVSRKVGAAVERNRLKRCIREWFRQDRSVLPRRAALVVIARPGAAGLDVVDVQRELGDLFR
jgi:ribonuclease P protein component